MKFNTRYIRIIAAAILVLAAAAGAYAAIPAIHSYFAVPETIVEKKDQITITENNEEEKAILRELMIVKHSMDTLTVLTVSGTVSARDMADSSNDMQADFYYSRQGNEAYYRLGDNEMLSLSDVYIVIAHDMKKIFVSAPKEVITPFRAPIADEVSFLSKESYKVYRTAQDSLVQISLINAHHASCREYKLTFDSSHMIHRAVMRMTDPTALTDVSKDKLINMRILSWRLGQVRRDLLRKDKYLSVVAGRVRPAQSLKGYELVNN